VVSKRREGAKGKQRKAGKKSRRNQCVRWGEDPLKKWKGKNLAVYLRRCGEKGRRPKTVGKRGGEKEGKTPFSSPFGGGGEERPNGKDRYVDGSRSKPPKKRGKNFVRKKSC